MNIFGWSQHRNEASYDKKKICHLHFKAAQMSLFSKCCTEWKGTVWLASGLHFQITDLVGFKRLDSEKTMNNSSYYIITEYLKPWESRKSYFSSVSTYTRMHFCAFFESSFQKSVLVPLCFDQRLLEPYLCDGACLRQQIRPLTLGLLGVVGVALTLKDKHYLPQVWTSTKDKDVRFLTPESGL